MRIGELVKRTQASKETIHYYIREGVLPKPRKPGKNVADYNESYVEKILMIKELQDKHFLPLSVIKKIIKQQKKKSLPDQASLRVQSKYYKPIDLFLSREITGREAFCQATGIGQKWLAKMKQWGVITPEFKEGHPTYSPDDVVIGKLIVDMDRLGFGPKDGHDPEDLRHIADFVREFVTTTFKTYIQIHLQNLTTMEVSEKYREATEVMGFFFYHLYRKFVREEISRFLKSIEEEEG